MTSRDEHGVTVAMPTHLPFIALICPLLGIALGALTFNVNATPLLFPLVSGFALMGPLAAIGLYELSRRRELGLDTSMEHLFDVFRSLSLPAILALGLLLLVIFVLWLAPAQPSTVGSTVRGSRNPSPATSTKFSRRGAAGS